MTLKDLVTTTVDHVVRTGAAADASMCWDAVSGLPRILRYSVRAIESSIKESVAAEIVALAPNLADDAVDWATIDITGRWRSLAARLDAEAVLGDKPALRSLADAVRLSSMTACDAHQAPADALRLIASLRAAQRSAAREGTETTLLAMAEHLTIGWMAIVSGTTDPAFAGLRSAHAYAYEVGQDLTEAIRCTNQLEGMGDRRSTPDPRGERNLRDRDACGGEKMMPYGHVLVCPALDMELPRTREAARGHEHIVGSYVPLVPTPDMARVRPILDQEYPYASAAIDRLLLPLLSRGTVTLPPTLLVGPPGAGKSRLVRRLAETLGVALWKTDGARASSAGFAGADRRWSTAECAHPLLAISRSRTANPLVLIDEIDKAGNDRQHGRLWDSLLGFMELETSRSYPDPCLQVEVDLSHVSLLMTCNAI